MWSLERETDPASGKDTSLELPGWTTDRGRRAKVDDDEGPRRGGTRRRTGGPVRRTQGLGRRLGEWFPSVQKKINRKILSLVN